MARELDAGHVGATAVVEVMDVRVLDGDVLVHVEAVLAGLDIDAAERVVSLGDRCRVPVVARVEIVEGPVYADSVVPGGTPVLSSPGKPAVEPEPGGDGKDGGEGGRGDEGGMVAKRDWAAAEVQAAKRSIRAESASWCPRKAADPSLVRNACRLARE